MLLFLEKHYPLIGAVFATVLGWQAFSYFPDIKLRYDILSAAITINSTLLGFLIATQSILFAIDESALIKGLKQAGTYKHIRRYLMSATNTSFFAAIVNFVSLFIPMKDSSLRQPQDIYIFSTWIFFTILPIFATQRALWMLNKIVQHHK